MKRILTLVLCWLIAFTAMAETTFKAKTAASVAGGYVTSLNKVDGSFEDGTAGWIASTDTIVQTASTEFQGNYKGVWSGTGAGTLDLQWTATASNTYEASTQVNVNGEDDVYVCAYVGPTETGCKLIPALNKIQKVSVVADSVISSAFYLRLKHTGSDAFSVDVDDAKIEPWTPQVISVVQKGSFYSKSISGGPLVTFTGSTTSESYSDLLSQSAGTFTAKKNITIFGGGTFTVTSAAQHGDLYVNGAIKVVGSQPSSGGYASSLAFSVNINAGDTFYFYATGVQAAGSSVQFSAQSISENVVQSWQDGMSTWSATSTIQIGATTTAPTKGTTDLDQVRFMKGAGSEYEFWYQYNQTAAGTAGSGDYLFTLPNGMQFDSSKVVFYTTLEGSGGWISKNSIHAGNINLVTGGYNLSAYIIPYDSTRFRIGAVGGREAQPSSMGVLGSSFGNFAEVGLNLSLKFSAPIAGASSGPTLLALPTSKENVFSARIDTSGNIISKSSDWIQSVAKSGTGNNINTITFKNGIFTVAPSVTAMVEDASSSPSVFVSSATSLVTSTTAVLTVYNDSGAIPSTPHGITIIAQKQSTDYTAPGVFISNLNPDGFNRTTGTTGLIDNFSFSYGTTNATTVCSASPCSYLDQIGNYVTSVTRSATGSYSAVFNKTYAKMKCSLSVGSASNNQISYDQLACSNCSSLPFRTAISGGGAADSFGTLMCQGQ